MKILTVIILFLSSIGCWAHSQRELLDNAAKAYNDSNYIESVNLYQQALKKYGADSHLYYNLGNAYTRLENYGSAVLNYRKSLKLNPMNRGASRNLAFVEQTVGFQNDKMIGDRNLDPTPGGKSFFTRIRDFLEMPGSNCLAWIAGVLFILFCSAVAIYLFVANPRWKKVGFFGGIAALILCAISCGLSFSSRRSQLEVTDCVLMVPQTQLLESPSLDAKKSPVPLVGGTTFRILERKNDASKNQWIKVWLNDDFSGWVRAEDVDVVEV